MVIGILSELKPCPDTPNCVSTEANPKDEEHYIEPIKYQGSKVEAKNRLLKVIKEHPRTEIKEIGNDYIHSVFKTRILRFKDDVEFVIDDENKMIHFRSASRIGKGDFGKNRKRMEKVKDMFSQ